jgi:hypothetical protein
MPERREIGAEGRRVLLADRSLIGKLAINDVGHCGVIGAGAPAAYEIAMTPAVNCQQPRVCQRIRCRHGAIMGCRRIEGPADEQDRCTGLDIPRPLIGMGNRPRM